MLNILVFQNQAEDEGVFTQSKKKRNGVYIFYSLSDR